MNEKYSARAAMRWSSPVQLLACGFGSGWAPYAPGTFGTLVAVPVVMIAQTWSWWLYVSVTLLMFALGVYICGRAAREWGVQDHPAIVWDEIVGYLVTMSMAPAGWLWAVAGFVLFRFFDITKPWPIRNVDRNLHGGIGIMLDDVLAGIYSGFVLYLGERILT